jgi:hypothetical protein
VLRNLNCKLQTVNSQSSVYVLTSWECSLQFKFLESSSMGSRNPHFNAQEMLLLRNNCVKSMGSRLFKLHYFFFIVLVVHCGIHKSSYNISYLNSTHSSFSFINLLSPHYWNSFNRSHFPIYLHVYSICTIFTLSYRFPISFPP